MKIPDIIDNREPKKNLKDIVKKILRNSRAAYIASGYFYLSGFDLVKDDLDSIEIFQMVIGDETNRPTQKAITAGYSLRNQLKKEINKVHFKNKKQQQNIKDLRDFIANPNKNVEIKIFTKNKFHSKAYIFEYKDVEGDYDEIGIVGSSNFTKSGLINNTELNTTLKQESSVKELKDWFNLIWQESELFNEDLLKIIDSSAPYIRLFDPDYLPPFELYKKILFHYLNQRVMKIGNILAEFQKIGVENVEDKIREFNGGIVSDSVGLGKSFIGGEMIKRFRNENKEVLCLVPAPIIKQWEELLKKYFNINPKAGIQIISHEKFSLMKEDEIKNDFNNIEFVLIDEAHRFRNKGSKIKRSKNIEFLKGKKFVLLTATPLNNSIQDIENLIGIFASTNRLISKNLDPNSFQEYKKLIKKERRYGPLELDEKIQKEQALMEITKILEQVMLLRTRTVIKSEYPNLRISGKKISFSNPIIKQIEYNLSKDLFKIDIDSGSQDFIADFIFNLNLPHIFLSTGQNGKTIGALYRILLLKRLESSLFAFVTSLDNLILKENDLKKELETKPFKEVLIKYQNIPKKDLEYLENDIDLSNWINSNEKKDIINPFNVQKQELLKMIEEDLSRITSLEKTFSNLLLDPTDKFSFEDNKRIEVKNLISQNIMEKQIIFTQFRDTADYLYYHIKENFPDKIVELIKGGERNKELIIKRFSPYANDCYVQNGEVIEDIYQNEVNGSSKAVGKEIDILISTDTLSEGVNLQDCDFIINYDLPWNPTRIIQRVGRIDRIGSNDQKYVFNLKTDDEIESLLGLLEKLKTKVKDITTIIGREYGILSDDEEINIKTIGERIKNVRISDSMEDLEQNAINSLFKDLKFGERKDSEIKLELRAFIKSLDLTEEDFKAYSLSGKSYCLIKEKTNTRLPRNFPFIYFKIYDKNTKQSLKDIILKINEKNEIVEIPPTELMVDLETEGMIIKKYDKKKEIESQISKIRSSFKNNLFRNFVKEYNPATKSHGNFPRIQQQINSRLDQINKNKQLIKSKPNRKKKIKEWKKIIQRIPFQRSHATKLKQMFQEKNPLNISEPKFWKILKDFKKGYIDTFAEYQEDVSLKKDISYVEICWGAFI